MEPSPIEVGHRIKKIRIKKGLSQKEFAKKTNSTIPAISNWENGRNLPNKERLKAIAELGEMSVSELLYGNEFDYVWANIPTDDYKKAEIFYDLYLEKYGKNSYRNKEEIKDSYELMKVRIMGLEMDSKTSDLIVSAHILSLLNNRLRGDKNFKEYFIQNSLNDKDNNYKNEHVDTLTNALDFEIQRITTAAKRIINVTDDSKEVLAKYVKISIDNYVQQGLLIDEYKVQRYIKSEILGVKEYDDYFFKGNLDNEN